MQNSLSSLRKIQKSKGIRGIPEVPGVYVFWNGNTPIYIGKAKNLKNRLGSYFIGKLLPKTSKMVNSSDAYSIIKVDSELESLLLEASLIRSYKPKYNFASRDDKHPLYLIITKEAYPRIITARRNFGEQGIVAKEVYGPFPSSSIVRSVLRMIRRIFPFADHKPGRRVCLYSHIGLCSPCPSEVENQKDIDLKKSMKKKYLTNISKVKSILDSRFTSLRTKLTKEMETYSKLEKFEDASNVYDQIKRLDYITQPIIPGEFFLQNPNFTQDLRNREIKALRDLLSPYMNLPPVLNRIECFDVSHLAGTNPTASMVTFINGEAEKEYYRHFRIRQIKGNDDIASMKEVAKRRSKHFGDWGKPDLIIVDGGKTQLGVFRGVFDELGVPIIGIAKREEKLVLPLKEIRTPAGPVLNLIQRIRDEAHRFARRYHHHLTKTRMFDM